ncbi:MAG: hydrolase [Rhodospirillaceae bacterium]|nr:hydrolase [Rhodospirillaceae bacterium]|tara:strand:- start:74 stop:1090 length:1017 start_codon:yes stop_codon:yes gene_type:complete
MRSRWRWLLIGTTIVIIGAASVFSGSGSEESGTAYKEYNSVFGKQKGQKAHTIPRDGYKLNAREYHPVGKQPVGAPYILMHGFTDSVHLYDRLAPLLAKKSRVITFDSLGWGNSDKPSDHRYDVASMRRDLEAVITYFGIKNAKLLVHDSSGLPGIDYAIDNPKKTSELILLNTLYGPSKVRKVPAGIQTFSTPGLRRDLLVFGATMIDFRWQQRFSAQVGEFFYNRQAREKFLPIFLHQSLQIRPAFFGLNRVWKKEIQDRGARLEPLRNLSVPVKIIFGTQDPYLNPALAREFKKLIPNSALHLVREAGHYVQLDRPEEVARLMLDSPAPLNSKAH